MDETSRSEANRERGLRRLAQRRGLYVTKARTDRYQRGGHFFVSNPCTNRLVSSEHGMTLDETEAFLKQEIG